MSMTKLLAILIAGLFSAGAFAQASPPATPGGPATKSQSNADAKVEARKEAKPGVKPSATPTPGGNAATASGSTMPVETKAQKASQGKKAKRNAKHPGRKGTTQGKTPT
jgi:hypothetical protein